ncbi:MAG: tetratricopeptide repeat protein [Desulfobacterales bacterium]|nr:tetratricopeptide repeat protein [Desulfobacterales bacterium]
MLKKTNIFVYCIYALCIILFSFACSQHSFKLAKQNNTIESYNSFLKKYPNSAQAKEAWQLLATLEFNKVKDINTVEAFKNFIKNYPKSLRGKAV